jgi:hypothetical protein
MGTPNRASGQNTITAMWKRPNQSRSPTKAITSREADTVLDKNMDSRPECSTLSLEPMEVIYDRKSDVMPPPTVEDETSSNSSATNKIENLQLSSLASSQESKMEESASTFDTSSLVEFPPLTPKKAEVPSILGTEDTTISGVTGISLTSVHGSSTTYEQSTPPSSTHTGKVQYNLYFRRGASGFTKRYEGDNLK